MALPFAKYEGLGNDFVVIEAAAFDAARTAASIPTSAPMLTEDQARQVYARKLCDRHRGIGADGLLFIEGDAARPRMRVINADGSQPEMCGNGLRCVALHWVRRGLAESGRDFVIDTDAGPHRCHVTSTGPQSLVEVSMRPASLLPSEVPVLASPQSTEALLDEIFEVAATQLSLTCVSMGNPHAITFDDLGPEARATLGPLLETHPRFPNAANIGFARVLGPQSLELAVWERGVGFTQACGTGACACAVAAVETGRAKRDEPITVRLPGGNLQIRVGERTQRISMTGPARHVFDGTIEMNLT